MRAPYRYANMLPHSSVNCTPLGAATQLQLSPRPPRKREGLPLCQLSAHMHENVGTMLVRREGEGLATLERVCLGADEPPGASEDCAKNASGADDNETGYADQDADAFCADLEGFEDDEAQGPDDELQTLCQDEDIHTGTEVVYLREQVAVWPSSRHCILGRLSLVKQCSVTFLAWLPYGSPAGPKAKPRSSSWSRSSARESAAANPSGLTHSERSRYAIHPIPMSEVRALRCRTPLLLVPSLVLVLQDGLSLPPLYFHAGGLRELITCLKKHPGLSVHAEDRSVYTVNDFSDPLPRALAIDHSLEEIIGIQQQVAASAPAPAGATASVAAPTKQAPQPCEPGPSSRSAVGCAAPAGGAPGQTSEVGGAAALPSSRGEDVEEEQPLLARSSSLPESRPGDDSHEDTSPWGVWLSGVQRKVKAAAAAVVSSAASEYMVWQESVAEGDVAAAAFYHNLDLELPGAAAAAAGVGARAMAAALGTWEQAPQGGGAAAAGVYSAVPGLGGEEERQAADGDAASAADLDGFELVDPCVGMTASLLLSRAKVQRPPLSADEWNAMFDQGRLVELETLRRRVYDSGMEPCVRREAWKFLLGVYPLDSTEQERQELMARRRKEYQALRMQWESISPAQASRFDPWRERCSRINKDARRTDRHLPFFALERGPNVAALRRILLTYAMYNFNLGYCQGMSDLASPLLYIMCDEVEAFWCFAALMERVGCHFDEQQSGVQAQLKCLGQVIQALDPPLHSHLESLDALSYFFCFRWLLVMFKREFRLEEVLRLWEAAWACPFGGSLFVYLAAAVLVHHRRDILEQGRDLDALLRLCCQLPGQLQLEPLLQLAAQLAGYAAAAGLRISDTEGLPAAMPLANADPKP